MEYPTAILGSNPVEMTGPPVTSLDEDWSLAQQRFLDGIQAGYSPEDSAALFLKPIELKLKMAETIPQEPGIKNKFGTESNAALESFYKGMKSGYSPEDAASMFLMPTATKWGYTPEQPELSQAELESKLSARLTGQKMLKDAFPNLSTAEIDEISERPDFLDTLQQKVMNESLGRPQKPESIDVEKLLRSNEWIRTQQDKWKNDPAFQNSDTKRFYEDEIARNMDLLRQARGDTGAKGLDAEEAIMLRAPAESSEISSVIPIKIPSKETPSNQGKPTIIVNPATGERMQLVNGKWQPI